MAQITLSGWPAGATVTASVQSSVPSNTPNTDTLGATVATGTASSAGTVTLSGLTEGTRYVATDGTTRKRFLVTPSAASLSTGLILPLHGVYVAEAAQVGVINRMYLVRARAPAAGGLRGVSYFVGATSGNVMLAAYDTGQATSGLYTKLGDSGSVAVGTLNTWQTWDPGAGVISLSQGQDVMLGIMFDNITASFGRGASFINVAAGQLPSGHLPYTTVLPKLSAIRTFGGFAAEATITDGNMVQNNLTVVLIGRVE